MIEINNTENNAVNINNNSLINENFLEDKNKCSHDEHKTHLIRYINIFCSQLHFSPVAHLMIIVLTVLSNNRNKFRASYAVIGKQLPKIEAKDQKNETEEKQKEEKPNTQLVRRRLNTLKQEQEEKGFSFFSWEVGSQKKEGNQIKNVPTEFEEHFYAFFKEDLELARKEAHKYDNFFKAMDDIFLEQISKRTSLKDPKKSEKEKREITEKTVFRKAENLHKTILLFEEKSTPSLSKEEIEKIKVNALLPLLENILVPDNLESFRSLLQKLEKEKIDTLNTNENDTRSYSHERREREGERGIIHDSSHSEGREEFPIRERINELADLDLRCIGCGTHIVDVLEAEEEICFDCQNDISYEDTIIQEELVSPDVLGEEPFEDQTGELEVESCKGCEKLSSLEKNGFCEGCSSMLKESQQMIMLFDSVGVNALDFNMIAYDPNHIRGIGKSLEYVHYCSPDELINHVNNKIPSNFQEKAHLFFRPRNPKGTLLVQLDDITEKTVNLLKDKAFLVINTSSNNFQAWVAVKAEKKDFPVIKESFLSFLEKFDSVDRGATNSIRACSKNLKPKYAPNFPIVTLFAINYGKILDIEELKILGLELDFSSVEKEKSNAKKDKKETIQKGRETSPLSLSPFREYSSSLLLTELVNPFPDCWKKRDYEFFLERAKYKSGTNEKDLSGVDFGYVCQKLVEGLDPKVIVGDLRERSLQRGKDYFYASRTVLEAQKKLIEEEKLKLVNN